MLCNDNETKQLERCLAKEFHRELKPTSSDGDCFFEGVIEQVNAPKGYTANDLRAQVVVECLEDPYFYGRRYEVIIFF